MTLTGDYHTHTVYSHGKGSVFDNARRAKEIGLGEIAISDHGFAQMAFGLRRRQLPQLIEDCRAAGRETDALVCECAHWGDAVATTYAQPYRCDEGMFAFDDRLVMLGATRQLCQQSMPFGVLAAV